MSDMRYLRQRRGRWLVQVAIPKDLRDHFGKTNIEKYLNTASLPEAKRRRHAAVADILASFDRARDGEFVRPEEIQAIAEAELRKAYDALAGDFVDQYGGLSRLAEDIAEDAANMISADISGNTLLDMTTTEYAEQQLERLGIKKTKKSVESLTRAILKAQATAVALLKRGNAPPPLVTQPIRRPRSGTAPKISEAGELFLTERQRDASAKITTQTESQMRATFRLFKDHTADSPLDAITRQDATEFLDTISGLHRHYGRRPGAAKLTLQELLKRFPAGNDDGLSNKTLNRHQSALKTLFRWARKRGMVDGENPFADLARPKARMSDVTWLPFTVDELNSLFAGASFDIKPKRHSLATARPWVMAIALFSGMRQGEACELAGEDVKQQDKVWYFDVTEAKSEAGIRRVPIHSELIRLGLLKYVKAIGKGPLFPGLTPSGPDKKRGHTLAKRFPAYRRDKGLDRERIAFHSFRKNFVRALELAQVDRDRAALIVGHERGFTYRVYNPEGLDLVALREVVEAVEYEGLKVTK